MKSKHWLALMTLALSPALADTVPVKSPPAVQGTVPLAGVAAALNTPYTLGRSSPLNVTLLRAEYSSGRVVIGQSVITPAADQKLLVLRFQVANPQKKDAYFGSQSLTFTAVDAQNTNRLAVGSVGRAGTGELAGLQLKPSQKLEFVTAIIVPAAGAVPKLIIEHEPGTGVLRYDLRTGVVPLKAPYADPRDSSGATALSAVPAVLNHRYPMENFDLQLESLQFSTEALGGRAVSSGSHFLVATVRLQNQATRDSYLGLQTLMPEILDADGERSRYVTVLKASRDEVPGQQIAPGAEYRVRYVFEVPENAELKTLTFQEGRTHPLQFDVSSVH